MAQGMTGFMDLDARGLAAMGAAVATLEDRFAAYGYARVEPPLVDWPDSLLERSGEETRRRVYMFDTPSGEELCLRPDLTVPVCRLALRTMAPSSGPLRLSYAGPVFRHEAPGTGRLRQFTQAGIELIGPGDATSMDAEVVAVAMAAARAAGIAEPRLILGDVRFFLMLLDHYPLPERLKIQLRRDFLRAPALVEALEGTHQGANDLYSEDQTNLIESVTLLGQEKAVRLIESFLAVAEINPVGARGIDEIVERLIETRIEHLTALPVDMAEQIREFLSIKAAPRTALDTIQAFGARVGVDFWPILEDFHRRLDLLAAHGVDLSGSVVTPGLKRDLEYYTGFIFDMTAPGLDAPLGGGGRYDQLLKSLDPDRDDGAAGFALCVEQILRLNQPELFSNALTTHGPLHAHVLTRSPADAAAAAETARALREAGWRVALDVVAKAGPAIAPRAAAYTIEVGTDENGAALAQVHNRADGTNQTVPLTQIGSFMARSR